MSLPSICFATKTYIPDIEKKGWPEINEDELLVENSDLENQVKYIANNMDGNELITPIPESIEEAIFTPEAHDVNPLIFYRLSRNVREGKVLPQLDLSRYFEKSGNNGFKLTISPVYTLSMDSGIIEKYQSKYEEVKSAIQDFDPALKQEFKLVFDKLMRKNLSETTKNRYQLKNCDFCFLFMSV